VFPFSLTSHGVHHAAQESNALKRELRPSASDELLRACDGKLEGVVAIKVWGPPLAASGTARQRLACEARAASSAVNAASS
jgi:hypothetical protein